MGGHVDKVSLNLSFILCISAHMVCCSNSLSYSGHVNVPNMRLSCGRLKRLREFSAKLKSYSSGLRFQVGQIFPFFALFSLAITSF